MYGYSSYKYQINECTICVNYIDFENHFIKTIITLELF